VRKLRMRLDIEDESQDGEEAWMVSWGVVVGRV